jgi:hypothetical protein
MDELLKYAIGYRLAFEIALATKADTSQVTLMRQLYEDAISMANLVDAHQAPVDAAAGSEWLNSRLAFPFANYRGISAG